MEQSEGHAHAWAGTGRTGRMAIVLALTATYMAVEAVAGLLTHSLALLADAGHMLTDVAGIGLALLAMSYARRPPSNGRSFGHQRVEILAALVNAVLLVGISLWVLYEAWQRFRDPPLVAAGPMLVVASIGMAVNLAGVLLLRGGADHSLNVKGAYFEVLSDFVTSLGVIVASVVTLVTGWRYADPIVSAGIGLFILPRTWRMLRETVEILLEGTPRDLDMAEIRTAMLDVPGVGSVHDLHAWSLTSRVNALSAHVMVADGVPRDEVLGAAHALLTSRFALSHVTLQVESGTCPDATACDR